MKMNLKYTKKTKEPKIIFYGSDGSHRYESSKGVKYTSVSEFCKKYFPEFDEEIRSLYSAMETFWPKEYAKTTRKHKKYTELFLEYFYEMVPAAELFEKQEYLKGEWERNRTFSVNIGTKIHKQCEDADLIKGYKYSPFNGMRYDVILYEKKYDNNTLADNLFTLPDGYYPELLMYNDKYKIAGQSDGVFLTTIGDERIVDIQDIKTDASIDIVPGFKSFKTGYPRLKSVLSHITDCNFNKYAIKMSMYMFMMEQFGFKTGKMAIEHKQYDETHTVLKTDVYKIPYLGYEVGQMVKDSRKKAV